MRVGPQLLVAFVALLMVVARADAADRGFYIGAGLGQAYTKVDDVFDSGYDFDEEDLGFKLFGGYQFFPWLGVEGAYIDGGSPEASESDGVETGTLEIEVQSVVAAAVFTLPITDSFELFIKPGIAFWSSTTTVGYSSPDFSESFSDDDSGSAFFLGGGAEIRAGNAGLRLEYEWFEAAPEWSDDTDEFVTEVDATAGFLSLSVVYRF